MAVPESWDSEAPCSSCPHARHLSWHPCGPAVLFPLVPEHPAYPCPGRCLLCCDGPAPGVGGDLGNPQPHWVEILRDTSPPVPSHASSISFHFPLSFRSHRLASLPLTPIADLEWMGEGQTRALEGVPWLSLGGGVGSELGTELSGSSLPLPCPFSAQEHGSYPEPGCLGFGQIQVWI